MGERCSGCDRRRVVASWHVVGGNVGGLLFPACRECSKAGWQPTLGRDYFECSEAEWREGLDRAVADAAEAGMLP